MKISLTPHQEKFIAKKMRNGGYLSRSEVVREALRVYELTDQQNEDPGLEATLRHSLKSPRKKYVADHFTELPSQNGVRLSL